MHKTVVRRKQVAKTRWLGFEIVTDGHPAIGHSSYPVLASFLSFFNAIYDFGYWFESNSLPNL